MGLPVTVFRWDDVGAPQLVNRRPSEMLDILRKCLVDGYGSKAPLGWTIPYEDVVNRKVVFRNSTVEGSGGFVQFWDLNGTDATGGALAYQHAKLMTALDTWIPNQNFYNAIVPSNSGQTPWVIIGTTRGFYLIISNTTKPYIASSIGQAWSGFFGDIDSTIPTDQNTFICWYYTQSNYASASWSVTMDGLGSGTQVCVIYDADNSGGSISHKCRFPYANMGGSSSDVTSGSGVSGTALTLGMVTLEPDNASTFTKDLNGVYLRSSLVRPLIRGAIPGLYNFAQTGYADQLWPVIINQDGRSYWMMRNPHVGGSNKLIDMDSWYD
jgi:hypothetical protein